METITVGEKKLGFSIMPFHGTIIAEIYYTTPGYLHGDLNIHVMSKEFKRWFKELDETDYIRARDWCTSHMRYIEEANK